tara:strand:+ start:142 stop:390 length:249 start_codon:yes stop_codon:yes gene_type:complete
MADRWVDYANKHLKGRRIVHCRYLYAEEAEHLGWGEAAVVLQMDDGSIIYPSCDDEGNGAGAMFGQSPLGEDLTFPVNHIGD